jgi:rod shape-determining protein MreD
MRSFSDQIQIALPALFALLLTALFSAPMHAGTWSLTPNVAWVMTLIVAMLYPPAWPVWFAFALGLVQDIAFGTPLGAQGLLTLLLVLVVRSQARRMHYQLFRIRWLEAAGMLVLWHLLLWVLMHCVSHDAAPLRLLLRAGLVSAVWYPLFYFPMLWLAQILPPIAVRH